MEPELTPLETIELGRLARFLLQDLADLSTVRPESQREQAMQIILDAFYSAYSVLKRGEHSVTDEDDDELWRLLLESDIHDC